MSVLATDNGNRANGAIGAAWTALTGWSSASIVSNAINSPGAALTPVAMWNNTTAWPNDQYAKLTVLATVETISDNGVGPAVRMSNAADTMYFIQGNTVETKLYKVVAGTFTQLGADGPAIAAGNTLELRAIGTAITAYKNGVAIIGPITDAAIASGRAGFWMSDASVETVDDWEGGDFGSAGPSLMGNMRMVMP